MLFVCSTLAFLLASPAAVPTSAETASRGCEPVTEPSMPPDAGPYMKSLNMRAPMAGQMKRDGMMMGDVTKMAAQKDKCMSEIMTSEERRIDGRQR